MRRSWRHYQLQIYTALVCASVISPSIVAARSNLKKVRLGVAATSVGFLPIYTAYHRGFYRDEGIDLEIILMSLAAANNAFFKGEIDYSAGLTGLALSAARNYPAKILIFTVAKPLQSFMSRNGAGRLAVLEQGVVDASLLSVPENIIALHKGYNELIFLGDVVNFPQNGFGTSVARIQQQPEEVYKMVRATLRGLLFVTDESTREQTRDIMMKQWRVSDTKLAEEMLGYLKRGLAKDAVITSEAVQYFLDLTRETSNVTQPITAGQVVDFSFLDRAHKELHGTK